MTPSRHCGLEFVGTALVLVVALGMVMCAEAAARVDSTDVITVHDGAPDVPFPHFWESMFGSGRAVLTLREDYRHDLRAVKAATDFRYVRFHNIFHDEVGLVTRDGKGKLHYNFSYVDQIYDGILDAGVRPFVELSFMPLAITSHAGAVMSFWYHPNVAPPKRLGDWDDLVRHFVTHLVERYGSDEVARWYFEVWNEPNIDFWAGHPRESTYFALYQHTAAVIKAVDARLRVGGPATAQAAWVGDFLDYAWRHGTPVDFVSSHVYANDTGLHVFGDPTPIPRNGMVCRAVTKLHEEIRRSPFPSLPLFLTEYNASYRNEPEVTDSVFMGPWLADTIRQCTGLVDMMSYWTLSDVFEEQGIVKSPFYGGFGLIAERGIPKPSFNAFALLHKLGNHLIPVASDHALVTKRDDGTLVIALWNDAEPDPRRVADSVGDQNGEQRFTIELDRDAHPQITIWRLDHDHGNALKGYDAMGRPSSPTRSQIGELVADGALPMPEEAPMTENHVNVVVPSQGLVVLEFH